jgi:hypothetical protein
MSYSYYFNCPDVNGTYVSSANQYWGPVRYNGTGRYILTYAKSWANNNNSTWLFFSNDSGDNWTRVVSTTNMFNWKDMSLSFTGQFMYATTPTSCYRSVDYGVTWTTPLTTGSNMAAVCCNYEGKIVYIATIGTGVYRSTDFGNTFSLISAGIPTASNRYQGCTSLDGQYVFFSGSISSGGLVRSGDGGTSWSTPLTGAVTSVCCDITGQKVAAVNRDQGSIYISSNYGVSFAQKLSYGAYQMSSVLSNTDFSTIITTNNSTNPGKLVFSTNMGNTWSDVPGITNRTSEIWAIYGTSSCNTISVQDFGIQSLGIETYQKSSYDIPSGTGAQTGILVSNNNSNVNSPNIYFNFTTDSTLSNYSSYSSYFSNLLFRNQNFANNVLHYLLKPPGIARTPTSYYMWCGTINYSVNGTDLGRYVCPKYTIYTSGTSATTRSECLGIFVILIGGGGGGGSGGVSGSSGGGSGGGGGGGGCIGSFYIENPNPGTAMSFTYAVGVGGAGGPIAAGSSSTRQNGNYGGFGGDTSFTYGGVTYIAGGGNPGSGGFGSGAVGGLGGNGGGIDDNRLLHPNPNANLTWFFNGNNGLYGSATYSGSSKPGGAGGNNGNFVGNSTTSYAMVDNTIVSVITYGDGGDGGRGDSSASGDKGAAGTAGTAGAVIVFEHYTLKYPDIPSITGTPGTDYSIVFGSEGALVSVYTNQTVKLKTNWSLPLNIALVGGGGSGSSPSYNTLSGYTHTYTDDFGVINTNYVSGGSGGQGANTTLTNFVPLADTFTITIGTGGNSNSWTDHNNLNAPNRIGGNSSIIGTISNVNISSEGGSIFANDVKPRYGGPHGNDFNKKISDTSSWAGKGQNGISVTIPTIYTGNSITEFWFGGGGGGGTRGMQDVPSSALPAEYNAVVASIPPERNGWGGLGGGGGVNYRNNNSNYIFPDGTVVDQGLTTPKYTRSRLNGINGTGGGGSGAMGSKRQTSPYDGINAGQVSGTGGSGICLMWFKTEDAVIGGTATFSYSNDQYKNDCIIITGSGTFTMEGNFNNVVDIWLVGGGGGGGIDNNLSGAGGGGGGGITILKNYNWVKNKTYTFTIGAGGTKGVWNNGGGNGGNGGSTTFMDGSTTIASAPGGSGGSGIYDFSVGKFYGGTAGARISNYPLSGNGGDGGNLNRPGPPGKSSIGYSNGSGTNLTYYYFGGGGGGGGGGSSNMSNNISGAGGLGGGGSSNGQTNGGIPYVYPQNLIPPYFPTTSLDGVPNSGGGGGGGPGTIGSTADAGNGGSGVAVIWFKTGTSQDWSQVVT